MVQETVEIRFTGSSASLKNALNSISSAMQRTSTQGTKLNQASKSLNTTIRKIGTNMRMVGGHLSTVVGRYITLYALTRTGIGLFKRAFFAVESFNSQVIQTAALWTSFSDRLADTPIAEVFTEAIDKSQQLHQIFIDINDQTLATVEQMGIVNRELAKQGVILDATNESQINAFKNLTNTIAILTAGMANVNIQFGQEIRAVLEGLARQGTTLSLVLKAKLGKEWRSMTKQWKKDGVLVEKLAEQFRGVDAAAIKLSGTWMLVGTSFSSLFDTILRLGMEDIFKEIIDAVASLNTYLKDNREELARLAKEGFEKISAAVKKLTGVSGLKTLEENLKTVTVRFKALFAVIASVATISAIGNLVLALTNLYNVITLIGSSAAFASFIAFAANPYVLGLAAVIGGIAVAYKVLNTELDDNTLRQVELEGLLKKQIVLQRELDRMVREGGPGIQRSKAYEAMAMQLADIAERVRELKKELGLVEEEETPKAAPTPARNIPFYMTAEFIARQKAAGESEEDRMNRIGEAIDELTKKYLAHHKEVTRSYLNSIDTWAKGGQDFQELWGNLAQNMTDIYRKRFFKPFASMLASVTELAVQFAINLFDAKKREALGSALLSAHEGAAAAFANAGGFPLGLAAYAATLAQGLAEAAAIQAVSYDVGTMNVPKNMPATVHQGEIIIPKTFSEGIRQGKATLGSNKETNTLLATMLTKLDSIAMLAKEKGSLVIQDEEVRVLTKVINNENFRLAYTGT